MADQVKNESGEVVEQVAPKAEVSELDKLLQSGNISAVNEYIAAEAAKQGIDPTQAPKRDEKGQFVSPTPTTKVKKEKVAPVVAPGVEESDTDEEAVTYTMTVDIGQGQTITVEDPTEEGCRFKAEIAEKAAQAALGVLEKSKPVVEVKKDPPKPALTADEALALGNKFATGRGVEAIEEYLDKNPAILEKALAKKGINVSELQESLAERRTSKQVDTTKSAVDQFREAHPEYQPSDKNKFLMGSKMLEIASSQGRNLEVATVGDLEAAYSALSEANWLDVADTEPVVEPVVRKKAATTSAPLGTSKGGHDVRKQDAAKAPDALTREQFDELAKDPLRLASWYNSQMEKATGQRSPY